MKKIYQTPLTTLFRLETQKMVATSVPQLRTVNTDADEEGEVLSRRSDIWEEEE